LNPGNLGEIKLAAIAPSAPADLQWHYGDIFIIIIIIICSSSFLLTLTTAEADFSLLYDYYKEIVPAVSLVI